MHSFSVRAFVASSAFNASVVTDRSPMQTVFFCLLVKMYFLVTDVSFLVKVMASLSDCTSSVYSLIAFISCCWRSASSSLALSSMAWSVSMMPPLLLSYTGPAGAPTASSESSASSPCELCTSAVRRAASAELNAEACTMTFSASTTDFAPFSCNIDADELLSRMAMALVTVSMISLSSFNWASYSSASSSRIAVTFLSSASLLAITIDSSSIFDS
mmetsp:Transcript_20836/g.39122  ORF Transcript_20836/g.39122 Transcript_20836/m.39122 type:complete len:216 (+) Transcript_20836:1181-1828(+)